MERSNTDVTLVNNIGEDILACEESRRQALLDEDWEQFAALLADDVVHVHGTGLVHTKANLLAYNREVIQFTKIQRGPLQIRQIGNDCAIMTGPMTSVLRLRNTEKVVESEMFLTQVWVRDELSWVIASFHAVRTD